MSADNWATCPKCLAERERDIAAAEAVIAAAYGSVSVEEFDSMRADLEAKRTESVPNEFREDYELGIDGDEFYVIYKGHCRTCGLSHKFERTERLNLGGAA